MSFLLLGILVMSEVQRDGVDSVVEFCKVNVKQNHEEKPFPTLQNQYIICKQKNKYLINQNKV